MKYYIFFDTKYLGMVKRTFQRYDVREWKLFKMKIEDKWTDNLKWKELGYKTKLSFI